MKKFFLVLLMVVFIQEYYYAALVDVYRKGMIKITPDPNFGKGTDWESLFYDVNKYLTVASDGSIFVSNALRNNIYKFSAQGKYCLTFGQRGEGKGDLDSPGELSVLDNRLILVSEYPLRSMVSLFQFSGKVDRKIRCNKYVYDAIALRDDKIAYLSLSSASEWAGNHTIFIKDLSSKAELLVESISLKRKGSIPLGNNRSYSFSGINNKVIIARSGNGNLVVGITNSPIIKIYSLNGKLLKSFKLEIPPVPVTHDYIENYKEEMIKMLQNNKYRRPLPKWLINKVADYNFSVMFDPYLPLYTNFIIDPEGNLLIFPNTTCLKDCQIVFQVYDSSGKYICNTSIDKGAFDFEVGINEMPFLIYKTSIYGLFERKGTEDISLEIVKADLK